MVVDGLTEQEADRARVALAAQSYRTDTVRIVERELGGLTHLVTSRKGLYAVSETAWMLVAHGFFFGIAVREGGLYVFESCDLPRSASRHGRIVRLEQREGRIVGSEVVAKGLDNGCHAIDFMGDRLHVVDTYNQQIIRFSSDWLGRETLSPLPTCPTGRWASTDPGYVHVNSLLGVDDRILLLLHNGSEHTGRTSEIAVYDADWNPLERWKLDGSSCHGLATLEDGELLTCDSMGGNLISAQGLRVPISPHMTRGLSVGPHQIVVGASLKVERGERLRSAGTITFLDRHYGVESVLSVPGAPTEIRRLDGQDSSLSSYLGTPSLGRKLKGGAPVDDRCEINRAVGAGRP